MFQTFLIQPLYNVFIFLVGVMPGGDVGLAIIVLTLIVRLVFYPAFAANIRTTMGMQAAQAELDEINKKYKDNPDEKTKRTMALFKERGIRPFASLVSLIVQIPIFIALYIAFFKEGFPKIDTPLLYHFVHAPSTINTMFLGVLNLLTPHNIVLCMIVGGLQYLVAHFSTMRSSKMAQNNASDKQAAQHMQQQMMLYFLPALMVLLAYSLPATVGLYFATGNVVSLAQEWLIRKQMAQKV
jgi:YidC/Oxa1 family membrane protein insertase